MSIIPRFYRWRIRKTKYWLPYEQQLHKLLFMDPRVEPLRPIITDQIATLYEASRSQDPTELAATYAYRCSQFYGVTDQFTLCEVQASNAVGVICFAGGMLASIRLTPNASVANPRTFQLQNAAVTDIRVPIVVDPPPASGWVAALENDGLLRRFGPSRSMPIPTLDPTYAQHQELFANCMEAVFVLNSEQYDFFPPDTTTPINDDRIGSWLPVLDLRELGGLAIVKGDNGTPMISRILDGAIEWSEQDLDVAIRRSHAELGKWQSTAPRSRDSRESGQRRG